MKPSKKQCVFIKNSGFANYKAVVCSLHPGGRNNKQCFKTCFKGARAQLLFKAKEACLRTKGAGGTVFIRFIAHKKQFDIKFIYGKLLVRLRYMFGGKP
jgi:hypothetical protein